MNDFNRKKIQWSATSLEAATEEIENARVALQFIGMALEQVILSQQHLANPEEISKGAAQITTWIDESLQRATIRMQN